MSPFNDGTKLLLMWVVRWYCQCPSRSIRARVWRGVAAFRVWSRPVAAPPNCMKVCILGNDAASSSALSFAIRLQLRLPQVGFGRSEGVSRIEAVQTLQSNVYRLADRW